MPREEFNSLVFTDFSLHKWTIEELDAHKLQYVGFGLEICPKSGKEHHQGWIYCSNSAKKSFKQWKKLFTVLGLEKMHYEAMKGSFVQNENYVSKDGKLTELGVKPMGNGKKRTLLEFKKEIDAGKDVLEIADSDDKFGTFLQYRTGLHEYAQHKRGKLMQTDREKPEVYIQCETVCRLETGLPRELGLSGDLSRPCNVKRSVAWRPGCRVNSVSREICPDPAM